MPFLIAVGYHSQLLAQGKHFKVKRSPDTDKFYDQIAWFETGSKRQRIELEYVKGGGFDFMPHLYRDTNLSKSSISFKVSDHYPLWTEFRL